MLPVRQFQVIVHEACIGHFSRLNVMFQLFAHLSSLLRLSRSAGLVCRRLKDYIHYVHYVVSSSKSLNV